jgi:hypothetical protein
MTCADAGHTEHSCHTYRHGKVMRVADDSLRPARRGMPDPHRSCSPGPETRLSHASGGSATHRGRRAHPREFCEAADHRRYRAAGRCDQGRRLVRAQRPAGRVRPDPDAGAGHRPQDRLAAQQRRPRAVRRPGGARSASWSAGQPPRSAWNRSSCSSSQAFRPNCRPTTSPCCSPSRGTRTPRCGVPELRHTQIRTAAFELAATDLGARIVGVARADP